MKTKIVAWLIGMIFERLSDDEVRDWVISGIDMLEAKVVETPNQWDDLIVLPMLSLAREVLDVEGSVIE